MGRPIYGRREFQEGGRVTQRPEAGEGMVLEGQQGASMTRVEWRGWGTGARHKPREVAEGQTMQSLVNHGKNRFIPNVTGNHWTTEVRVVNVIQSKFWL